MSYRDLECSASLLPLTTVSACNTIYARRSVRCVVPWWRSGGRVDCACHLPLTPARTHAEYGRCSDARSPFLAASPLLPVVFGIWHCENLHGCSASLSSSAICHLPSAICHTPSGHQALAQYLQKRPSAGEESRQPSSVRPCCLVAPELF